MFNNIIKRYVFFLDTEVKLFCLYVLLICYMLYGTGMFSDDFSILASERNYEGIGGSIMGTTNLYLERPFFKYLYVIFYCLMDHNQFALIDFLKIFHIVISFYMVTRFFSMFLDAASSMMVSFLFIFFPTHEATTYCYLEINQTLAISLYLYAYYLAESTNRLITAGIISTLASFVTYGSTPVAFSLFVLCALKKSYKKGLVLLIPNIIYCGYYVSMTEIMNEGVKRLPEVFHFSSFIKQFLLQIGSFIDAIIGPSFFLKVWYSILENSTISIILGVLFITGYIMILKSKKEEKNQQDKVNKKLFTALIVLTLSSLVMFAITGYYPQMAFNQTFPG